MDFGFLGSPRVASGFSAFWPMFLVDPFRFLQVAKHSPTSSQ
jgi:hypothetical protein